MVRRVSLCLAASFFAGASAGGGGVSTHGAATAAVEHWGGLCETGVLQSPISVESCTEHHEYPLMQKNLTMKYTSPQTTLVNKDGTLTLVPAAGDGNKMSLPGYGDFTLNSCTVHMPSEHQINHNSYPMELQCKHYMDGTDNKKTGMLSIFLEVPHPAKDVEDPILDSAFLGQFQTTLPTLDMQITIASSFASILGVSSQKRYFTYTGSQIKQPCEENALWILMMDPTAISQEQLDAYNASMQCPSGVPCPAGWKQPRHPKPLYGRHVTGCQNFAKSTSVLSTLILVVTAVFARF